MPISTLGLRWVGSGARVGHLGNEPGLVGRRVGGRLDPAVGQGDGEGALHVAVCVLRLCLLEVGLAVVVGDAVLVGEGLGGQLLNDVVGGGSVTLAGDAGHKAENAAGKLKGEKCQFDQLDNLKMQETDRHRKARPDCPEVGTLFSCEEALQMFGCSAQI